MTPPDQNENKKDIGITADIRKQVVDSKLSVNARNANIVTQDDKVDNQTKSPEGATIGASTGALLGGGLGWLAGIGALAIPGVGPFIAAGPIVAAIAGVALGGTVGGVTGALIGLGIPEYEAKLFEGKLKGGRCLISVHSETSAETLIAKQIFEKASAEDISTSREASVATGN